MRKKVALIISAVCIIMIFVSVAGLTVANSIAFVFLYERVSNQLAEAKVGIVNLHNPTYDEMRWFLTYDTVSEREYVNGSYVCGNFAMDTAKNAIKQGIICAYVELEYTDNTGHAVIAFQCTDFGLIYIEPQDDDRENFQVGQGYLTGIVKKIVCIW